MARQQVRTLAVVLLVTLSDGFYVASVIRTVKISVMGVRDIMIFLKTGLFIRHS